MNHLCKSLLTSAGVLLAFLMLECSGDRESAAPGVLISTNWLYDHLNDPNLVILHSGTSEVYDSVHIPGARLIDPYSFTVNTAANRNEMPPADSIAKLLREVGVNSDSQILLYNENIGLLNRTARVFLALDYLGLGEQTKVLSGGLPAWSDQGHEVSDVHVDPEQGNFELSKLKELFVTAAELDKNRWSRDVVLIDARSDEEYYGTSESEETVKDGGHIEGAYLLSYLKITSDDSPYLFRSDSELEELFQEAGMDPERTTLIYCNSGIKGSLVYLATRHLGYPALLYDGSYEEWDDLDLPFIGPVALPDTKE